MYPWLDRSGRLSLLKLIVFLSLFGPGAWTAGSYVLGALGPMPITEAIHNTGFWTIRLLFASLAITPLRQMLGWPKLIIVRRMIGVAAFAYGICHLTLYAADQKFHLLHVGSEILLRFYLTIGFVALLGLSTLAATSTDRMVRRLGGKRWQRLHRIIYLVALLAAVHFFIQAKADVVEPIVMGGLYAWLMLYRGLAWTGTGALARARWAQIAITLVATALTAEGEAIYFWLKVGVAPMRVLDANFMFTIGTRPAWVVLGVGLGTVAAGALAVYAKRLPELAAALRRATPDRA